MMRKSLETLDLMTEVGGSGGWIRTTDSGLMKPPL